MSDIKVVRVSSEHHRKIKRLSVEKGRTMTEIVEEALENYLEKPEVVRKAVEDYSEEGG